MQRLTILLVVPLFFACSGDETSSPAATTLPANVCVTTPAPEGRLVHVTLDDVVGGFGSLGSRANSGLTAGVVRVELEADAENAGPASVRIMKDGVEMATIAGVAASTTCGVDLEVTVGTYQILGDADQDVEFEVTAGD